VMKPYDRICFKLLESVLNICDKLTCSHFHPRLLCSGCSLWSNWRRLAWQLSAAATRDPTIQSRQPKQFHRTPLKWARHPPNKLPPDFSFRLGAIKATTNPKHTSVSWLS
jgi:hypothetical protein